MPAQIHGAESPHKNIGWRVVFAGVGINLALGILYTWSVIAAGLPEKWTQSDKSWPYAVACLVFCLVMVPAGRMQDKLGPRLVASVGGILVGMGMVLASFITTPMGYILGFGVLAGAGIGFGYASATPPAVKWFPPAKTGMIAGIVVSGFGLASVYAAPLARWLTVTYGLETMMRVLGMAFVVVVVGLAQLLKPPHRVQQFILRLGKAGEMRQQDEAPTPAKKKEDFLPSEILRTWQFWLVWFMYACGAGAGLMVISVAKNIGKAQAVGVMLVVALAIGNGAGRIIAGIISDKLGRKLTLFIFFVLQAILVFLLSLAGNEGSVLGTAATLAVLTGLVGASYGSNLTLFPSITKDFYGLKNFGMNYGLVFTAWGVGGFMLAKLAGWVYDATHSFNFAYYCSAALLVVAAAMTFALKPPHHSPAEQAA